jgi:SAM-dependent methyltransferase
MFLRGICVSHVDDGNVIDWGRTSGDYARHRPNYPDRFFDLLASFGVGLRGQRIVDLGTGVGFLALRFAQRGAIVTGIDIAEGQIEEARRRCTAAGLTADFLVGQAESTGLLPGSLDAVTASQAWLYFDTVRAIAEVHRLLKPDGVLVTSHFCWLPRRDPIAKASEELVLRYNPKWTGADWAGQVPLMPTWAEGHFELRGMFVFDEPIPFTRASWRGRIRACRGVGATLRDDHVERLDREHEALLRTLAPADFSVLHRVDAHLLRPIRAKRGDAS